MPSDQVETISAREAAEQLGVKLATLYAYASRGLLHSEPDARGRGHRYARADVDRLKARTQARSGHGPVAAGALRWGEPVLSTALSTITAHGPVYRGEPVLELVRRGISFEAVADLLLTGTINEDTRWSERADPRLLRQLRPALASGSSPLATLLAAVPLIALRDPDRIASSTAAEWQRARSLLRTLAAVIGFAFDSAAPLRAADASSVAESACLALDAKPRRARKVIEQVLILCADHELNASTFAARVVASTGADLYACVSGALAAMNGPLHGGASDRVEALLDEVKTKERA
jgi:citrate synthase